MPKKKLPTLSEQFEAAECDLRRQYQLAAPIVRLSLWNDGVEGLADSLLKNAVMLAGQHDRFRELWVPFCLQMQAAFALGIATGQSVPAEAFRGEHAWECDAAAVTKGRAQ